MHIFVKSKTNALSPVRFRNLPLLLISLTSSISSKFSPRANKNNRNTIRRTFRIKLFTYHHFLHREESVNWQDPSSDLFVKRKENKMGENLSKPPCIRASKGKRERKREKKERRLGERMEKLSAKELSHYHSNARSIPTI